MKTAPQKFSKTDPWRKIVLENALDAVVGINEESIVIDWNLQAEGIFGWTKDEAIGRMLPELVIPPHHRNAHFSGVEHFLKTGEGPILNRRIEIEAIRKDGKLFPVELTVIPLLIEDEYIFYSFVKDLTAQKEVESFKQRLQDDISFLSEMTTVLLADPLGTESRLRKFIDMILPDWGNRCIVYLSTEDPSVNKPLIGIHSAGECRIHTAVDEESLRTIISKFIQNHQTAVKDRIPEAEASHFKAVFLDEIPMGSYVSIPMTAHSQLIGHIVVFAAKESSFPAERVRVLEEATHRLAFAMYNSQLFQEAREALRAREEFLSIASHELKTPLTSIVLSGQVVRRSHPEGELAPDLKRFLDLVDKNMTRMLRLIEDMLDISRISQGTIRFDKKSVNLGQLLEDLIARRKEELERNLTRYSVTADSDLIGTLDLFRIEQVFSNLINNVLKYAPKSELIITAKRIGNEADILFEDTGKGLTAENLELIFRRFERAHQTEMVGGLGLGLYISRQIIEAHGGKIWAEHHAGRGAIFRIRLPLNVKA